MTKTTKIIAALGVVAGLGVAALPLNSHAAEQEVEVNVTVESSISLELGMQGADEISFTVTPGSEGAYADSQVAKISTNSSAGYKLTVADKDSDNSLEKEGSSAVIAAGTTFDGTVSNWGIGTTDDGSLYTFFAVPKSTETAHTIRSTIAPVANDIVNVRYKAAAAEGQESGLYTDTIVYTATTND